MPITISGKTYNPAICLAPMEDVTDSAFRRLCKEFGADVLYTEFISSEALIRDAVKAHRKMFVNKNERPIGIQLYGSRLESVMQAGKMAVAARPDFIDLNVGCPVTKVADQGMGAGLLKNCDLMATIVRNMKENLPLPITVKTRLGWDENSINILENIKILAELGVSWVAIHGRTRAQGYKGSARWEYIKQAKALDLMPIVGNGDINSVEDAEKALVDSKCDGLMIGRGAIKKPWIFREIKTWLDKGIYLPEPEFEEKIEFAKKHIDYLMDAKENRMAARSFARFSGTYFKGVKNVAKVRQKLALCRSGEDIMDLLNNISALLSL